MPDSATLPPDDLARALILAQPDSNQNLPHLGVVGDTYTILLSGADTAGRLTLIDMHIPPNGGPPPHRHSFEETFILLSGQMDATVRGEKSTVLAGDTIHIPGNAPHQFHNSSAEPVRLLCICSPAVLPQPEERHDLQHRRPDTAISRRVTQPVAEHPDHLAQREAARDLGRCRDH